MRFTSLIWWTFPLHFAGGSRIPPTAHHLEILDKPSHTAGVPLDSFVSFSFEFSSFPDYAGNLSSPNNFSYNLLTNIGKLLGSYPEARVGGNTQDIAIFDESQKQGLVGIVNPAITSDYPTQITFGPAYFESYKTWPGIKYSHGYNMGANASAARAATLASVPYACQALASSLAFFEYGNEPDLFHASGYRPADWNEQDYVREWLNGTRSIKAITAAACPRLSTSKFMAPSFAGVAKSDYNTLSPVAAWATGLDADDDIGIISSHNYMGVSTLPGVTLQGTLMNHTNVIEKAAAQLNVSRAIAALRGPGATPLPFILGEHNSLARQGRPGLSNSFGAALWGLDWNVYLASQNISRSHMHQGTNYRYQSWQPISTNLTTIGTKAPYYSNIAVAAFLSKPNSTSTLQVTHVPQYDSPFDATYIAYLDNRPVRVLLINLQTYNTSSWNTNYTSDYPRPSKDYNLRLPSTFCNREVKVQNLMANGSDAITGITFNGFSYNYELGEGKPVRLDNVTCNERLKVGKDQQVVIRVPWSSATIVNLE